MSGIQQLREKYPEYNDLSDEDLAEGFRKKYYSDIPKEDYQIKMGIEQVAPTVATEPTVATVATTSEPVATEVPSQQEPNWFQRTFADGKNTGELEQEAANRKERQDAVLSEIGQKINDGTATLSEKTYYSSQLNTRGQESAGRITSKVIKETVTAPIEITSFATQMIAPETAQAIADSPVGELYKIFDTVLEPKLSDDEAIIAELTGLVVMAGAGKRLAQEALEYIYKKKGRKKAAELAEELSKKTGARFTAKTNLKPTPPKVKNIKRVGLAGAFAGATQAEVQFTPRERESLVDIIANVPKVRETLPDVVIKAADALKVNPEDTDAQATLKRYGSSIAENTVLMGVLFGTGKALKGTAKGLGTVVGSERIGKINTGLGRLLASKAALPDEIFEGVVKRENAAKGYGIIIKKQLKDLQRLQKKEGASDESLAKYVNEGDPSDLPTTVVQKVDEITTGIKNNEAELSKLLDLSGKNQLGLSVGKDGIYFTRTFEASNNPAYLRRIKKVLKDKSSDAEFVSKVAEARKYFLSKGVKQEDVDGVIEEVVSRLTKEDKSVINDIFGGSSMRSRLGEGAAKVLIARKNLDRPVLDLLGEISEPYKKLSTTLLNQNKLISEIKFLKEVEGFAKANVGKDVSLPGLFPMLPSVKTTFKQGAPFVDGAENLSKIADEAIGKFGGNSVKILQDMYTSPQMGKYINNGLEIFNAKGKGGSDFFTKAAALAQAKETILDAPAYLLNLSGGVQSLIANGHILNPRAYRAAVTELNTLAQQITLRNQAAVNKIARLRELGVLDQDLTGEMISRNTARFGSEDAKTAFGKFYVKSMKKFGDAYGQPDVYTKLIAFESELASLRKVFPNKTEDELFIKAAEVVRNTMPTYGLASPAARQLSRIPFVGNYVLFPSEVIRTTKNIAKYAAKDVQEGIATGNGRQVARGLARLTGLGVTAGGVDAVVNTNNEIMGVSDNNKKVVNVLAPDWAKGSVNYYLERFVLDETGEGLTKKQKETFRPYIRTRYVSSSSADAFDYLKSPVRLVLGKLLGSGSISESEIDDAFSNAASTIMSPYTSPKFAAEAVLNVLTGVNRKTGKPIYDEAVGATTKDKILAGATTLLKGYEGGSVKIVQDYIKSKSSEELLGEGNAQRDSGFPINPEDLQFLLRSGVRSVTTNVTQAMGYNLSKDLKALAMTKDNFIKEVSSLPFEVVTDEALDEVIKKYTDLQERKYKGMQEFTKKTNEFKDLEYIRRYKDATGKIKEEDKVLGIEGVIGAATNNFWYKGNDTLIQSLAADTASSVKNGVFMPDNVFKDKRMLDTIRSRGFSEDQIGKFYFKLANVYRAYAEKPLVEVEEETSDAIVTD